MRDEPKRMGASWWLIVVLTLGASSGCGSDDAEPSSPNSGGAHSGGAGGTDAGAVGGTGAVGVGGALAGAGGSNVGGSGAIGGSASVQDGATLVVEGPAVAQLPSVEWLGGLAGHIDSATPDTTFQKTGWAASFPGLAEWKYSTERVLSRSNAIVADTDYQTPGEGRRTYFFDLGEDGVQEEYFSSNYYLDSGSATELQWKILRLLPKQLEVDGEDPSWYTAHWMNGVAFMNEYGDGSTHWLAEDSVPFNEWIRIEVWFKSNTPGAADGSWRRRVTRLSDGSVADDSSFTSIEWRTTQSPEFRYACLQNYLGNESPTGTRMRVYMDDVYLSAVSSGTGAFVHAELIDAPTVGGAKNRAICQVNSITGTSWSVTLNQGTLPAIGGAYLALFGASDTDATATVYGPL